MAVNDIQKLGNAQFGSAGSRTYKVAASATLIYPGEIVAVALGGYVVAKMATNKPVCGTDFLVGIATTTSTNTASAVGYVDVEPLIPGQIYLANPYSSTAYATQAAYDLLVGDRVLFDLSAGNVYTILAADGATYGCVVEPLDISKYPGKVAFSFKSPTNYLSPSS